MKYKIDLRNYDMPRPKEKARPKPAPGMPEVKAPPRVKAEPYEVKKIIFAVMLSPNQAHKGFRFYTVSKIAKRIGNCKEKFIVLDAADYGIVKACFDSATGFSSVDEECVRRVYEPEEIVELSKTSKKDKAAT